MNPDKVAEIRNRLHDAGLRTTIARITLLYVLERSTSPKTAAELLEEAQPTINDRSTITRVLRDLEDLGFCHRIQSQDEARYVGAKR